MQGTLAVYFIGRLWIFSVQVNNEVRFKKVYLIFYFPHPRGLTSWELYLAKKCFLKRKCSLGGKSQQELNNILKIVTLCLQEENSQSLPGKILNKAKKEMAENNCVVSKEDISQLYTKMSDQSRDNLRFCQSLHIVII